MLSHSDATRVGWQIYDFENIKPKRFSKVKRKIIVSCRYMLFCVGCTYLISMVCRFCLWTVLTVHTFVYYQSNWLIEYLHTNVIIERVVRVYVNLWRSREIAWINIFRQTIHLVSPWLLLCFNKLLELENAFGQTSHRNGFSPVCTHLWLTRLLDCAMVFKQTSQL